MAKNAFSFVVLLILSLGTAVVIYALVRESLRNLLDETIRLPSGTAFYSRILLIGLLFLALSAALGTQFNLEAGSAFMEHVWKVALALSSQFGYSCLFLTAYLLLITILVAVMRPRHDQ